MEASSSLSGFPAKGGLIVEDDISTAWCAAEENEDQWLQVDLREDKDVMAVALQGRYHHSWVTTFYIQYSTDGNTWYCYGSATDHKVDRSLFLSAELFNITAKIKGTEIAKNIH